MPFSNEKWQFRDMNMKLLENPIERQREHLGSLLIVLNRGESIHEKIEILNALPEVDTYFSFPSALKTFLSGLSPECEYVIKGVFAIGQGARLFEDVEKEGVHRLRPLLEDLIALETFYQDLGGIVGYQHLVLTLLTREKHPTEDTLLFPPEGTDLSSDTPLLRKAIIQGIKDQEKMGELYPVGGAADRLQLKDEKTEEGLPAARLIFLGKPLLEGVISDLQAREYLHYKLFNAQITTPIGMMTSRVHRNHEHIRSICIQNKWFGRLKSSFKFFKQPSVPTFTKKGNWCLQKPLKLLLNPGGHGMLWKLLKQERIFEWFDSFGAKKALVRQINNPMAAIDYGLLAFLGIGHKGDKAFGFASCPRLVDAQEGMNVVKEVNGKEVLTNIEYCDFEKCGIEDKPSKLGGKYSPFPSNTNILFADLKEVEKRVEKLPNPGLLVNFRKGHHYHDQDEKEEIARLETTMQNIADAFQVEKGTPLPTYLTFNERRKTISTTKRKSSVKGKMLKPLKGVTMIICSMQKSSLRATAAWNSLHFPMRKHLLKKDPLSSLVIIQHWALSIRLLDKKFVVESSKMEVSFNWKLPILI